MRWQMIAFLVLTAVMGSCAHATPTDACRTRVNECLARCPVNASPANQSLVTPDLPMDQRTSCERQCHNLCLWD